jgi:hypothetical protein
MKGEDVAENHDTAAIFTPDTEPYLGLGSLLWFDRIIVWALASSGVVASYTHEHKNQLSDLQHAAC